MRNLKVLFVIISVTASLSLGAEEKAQVQNPVETVKSLTTPVKKEGRKKKATMCEECGKPEKECECDHSKEEGEKKK